MRTFLRSALTFVALFLCAAAFAATQSSSIVITPDGKNVWSANTDNASVSVFDVSADTPVKLKEIKVGGDPRHIVLDATRSLAFVTTTRNQTVVPIDLTSFRALRPLNLGGQPEAMVLSPSGGTLYVANTAANTIQRIDTTGLSLTLTGTLDLDGITQMPFAVMLTNDGDLDEDDESIFVTDFYGQSVPGTPIDMREGFDTTKEGRVAVISTATFTCVDMIELAPLADTGFNSNGQFAPATGGMPAVASKNPPEFTTPTGAFPNQLRSIVLHPTNGKAYVLSTGASPNGPLRFDTNTQPLISVVDVATRLEVTSGQTGAATRTMAPLNMNRGVEVVDDPLERLFFSTPWELRFKPDGSAGYITVQGSDVVVRAEFDANGIPSIGAPLTSGPGAIVRLDLQNSGPGFIPGKSPRGIAIRPDGTRAYVQNLISRSISVLNISDPTEITVVGTALSTKLPKPGSKDALALLGQELFNTGLRPLKKEPGFSGRFAMSNNGWGSCFNCHPDGLSDNLTWMFPDGPRQTPALDGSSSKGGPGGFTSRILNWSATSDEIHDVERKIGNISGGLGLIDTKTQMLVFGGAGSTAVEVFDAKDGSLSTDNPQASGAPLPQLPADRRDFTTVTLADGRVLLIGGRSGAGAGTLLPAADAVLLFDPKKNVFTPKSSRGFTPRHSLGAAAVRTSSGTRIYAIGGYASTDPNATPVGTVEEYNPTTNKWRTVAPLATAVAQCGVAAAGGTNMGNPRELVHVCGGNTATEANGSLANATPIQRFDPDPLGLGVWTPFNPAGITPRRNHGAIAVQRGNQQRIFLCGGHDAAGNALDSVQEYFPDNVVVVNTVNTPLPAPRARFGLATVPSRNEFYVCGGTDAAGVAQDTIFACDYSLNHTTPGALGSPSGVWRTAGMLSTPRSRFGVANPIAVGDLFPVSNAKRDPRLDAIAFWINRDVRSMRGVGDPKSASIKHGRQLFGTIGLTVPGMSCASCHGGKRWSSSRVDFTPPPPPENVTGIQVTATKGLLPVLFDVGTYDAAASNEIRGLPTDQRGTTGALGVVGYNVPSLLSVRATPPYFHNGSAKTLDEVFNGTWDAHRQDPQMHFLNSDSAAQDRADLINFLWSIDDKTPEVSPP